MIISSLNLENFRVFKGNHRINLGPNKNQPIVLFGGLNGAGKTSILTAVKLALFGKASLKGNITSKIYSDYLEDQINRGDGNLNSASVALEFDYTKLGKLYRYQIMRSWALKDEKIKESLVIYENDKELSELNISQAQSFIFDLIPLGVADLFFFDGEKIKEMADDEDGIILIDALKKLVGVDLVEKAAFDTGVVLRKSKKMGGSKEDQKLIDRLESELRDTEEKIESLTSDYGNSHLPYEAELAIKLRKAKQKLDESGGAWSRSRDELIAEQGTISAEKKELESKMLEMMRGDIIFASAPTFVKKLLLQLKKDLLVSKSKDFNDQIDKKISDLKVNDSSLLSLVEQLKNKDIDSARHQVSSYQFSEAEKSINQSSQSKNDLLTTLEKYENIETKLDNLGLNISRAPDESELKAIFSSINAIELDIEKANYKKIELKREIKEHLNIAIKLTYDLDKAYAKLKSDEDIIKIDSTGNKVIKAMEKLSKNLITDKISELELEFNRVFQRLTRKKDMAHQVRINPENFKIELIDKLGKIVNKKRISSGEKQIYAFSMLESLGKVSGRALPFIVDTPLGRLDSNHRTRLVENFFPKIGEQVIVLSTDTEVDSEFYEALAPHIGKSYEIVYNESEGSSSVDSGYFWSKQKEGKVELLA
jgi:DNA sulfur modification protein DndD